MPRFDPIAHTALLSAAELVLERYVAYQADPTPHTLHTLLGTIDRAMRNARTVATVMPSGFAWWRCPRCGMEYLFLAAGVPQACAACWQAMRGQVLLVRDENPPVAPPVSQADTLVRPQEV